MPRHRETVHVGGEPPPARSTPRARKDADEVTVTIKHLVNKADIHRHGDMGYGVLSERERADAERALDEQDRRMADGVYPTRGDPGEVEGLAPNPKATDSVAKAHRAATRRKRTRSK